VIASSGFAGVRSNADALRSLVVLLALAGCAVSPRPLPSTHAATASASPGRLAGAPPSLRPGVVEYKDVRAVRTATPPDHSHHHK